jgi:hypothetical protein
VAALTTGLTPVFAFVAAMFFCAWAFERPECGGVRTDPGGLGSPKGLT